MLAAESREASADVRIDGIVARGVVSAWQRTAFVSLDLTTTPGKTSEACALERGDSLRTLGRQLASCVLSQCVKSRTRLIPLNWIAEAHWVKAVLQQVLES